MAISPLTERIIYSDLFTNLDIHPVRKTVLRKTNVDAVKQSIRNLLLTDRGERPFQPDLGGNIRAMLFESATPQTFDFAKQHIEAMIESYEPRADVMDVVVSGDPDSHTMFIQIVFRVINIQDPITLEVILERVR